MKLDWSRMTFPLAVILYILALALTFDWSVLDG